MTSFHTAQSCLGWQWQMQWFKKLGDGFVSKTIYKAYFLGLCKWISPQTIALYGTNVPPSVGSWNSHSHDHVLIRITSPTVGTQPLLQAGAIFFKGDTTKQIWNLQALAPPRDEHSLIVNSFLLVNVQPMKSIVGYIYHGPIKPNVDSIS